MLDLGNPRDRVLPFIMFVVAVGFAAYFFINLDVPEGPKWVAFAAAMFAFFGGCMFMMFTDKRGPH